MPLIADRCICLRKVEYSETSQILTLLGRSRGSFRVIAKGAHRRTKAGASRFDGGVDLLDLGDAVMTDPAEKELATLTEWKLADGHLDLRSNLRSLHLALYAIELTGLLVHDNDPHPQVFDLLLWLTNELTTPRLEESFIAFELELLRQTGFLPELSLCTVCGRPMDKEPQASFSPPAGGLVCPQCQTPPGIRLKADMRLVRMLQMILKLPQREGIPQRLPRLGRPQSDPVNRLLYEHIRYIVGHSLRLPDYIM